MNLPYFLQPLRSTAWMVATLLVGLPAVAPAQTQAGRIGAVAPVAAPAAPSTGAPAPGLPSPSGLQSRFPAGLTAATLGTANRGGTGTGTGTGTGGGAGSGGGSGTGGGGGSAGGNGNGDGEVDLPVATNVMGAGAPQPPGVGPGPYTVVDAARSFLAADANRDGELSRAEARRLTLGAFVFEELDADHDGIITRWEYDDAMSP